MSLSSLNTENETNLKTRLPCHQQSASSLSHLSCFPGTVYYEVATHLLTHRTHCTPSPGGRLTTQLTCMHSFLSRLEHLLTQNSIFSIPQRSPCGRLSSLLMSPLRVCVKCCWLLLSPQFDGLTLSYTPGWRSVLYPWWTRTALQTSGERKDWLIHAVEQLAGHMQKRKQIQHTAHIKINSVWIKDIIMRSKRLL